MNPSDVFLWIYRIISLGVIIQTLELLHSSILWRESGAFRSGLPGKPFRLLLVTRILLAISLLFMGLNEVFPYWLSLLWIFNWVIYWKFQGALTGGSDYMMNIIFLGILWGLFVDQRTGIYFIAVQALMSYVLAGAFRLKEPSWRNGTALSFFLDATLFRPGACLTFLGSQVWLMRILSWTLIFLEIAFPLLIVLPQIPFQPWKIALFVAGGLFHALNSYLFGINRFIYSWIATYPAIHFLSKSLPI